MARYESFYVCKTTDELKDFLEGIKSGEYRSAKVLGMSDSRPMLNIQGDLARDLMPIFKHINEKRSGFFKDLFIDIGSAATTGNPVAGVVKVAYRGLSDLIFGGGPKQKAAEDSVKNKEALDVIGDLFAIGYVMGKLWEEYPAVNMYYPN